MTPLSSNNRWSGRRVRWYEARARALASQARHARTGRFGGLRAAASDVKPLVFGTAMRPQQGMRSLSLRYVPLSTIHPAPSKSNALTFLPSICARSGTASHRKNGIRLHIATTVTHGLPRNGYMPSLTLCPRRSSGSGATIDPNRCRT